MAYCLTKITLLQLFLFLYLYIIYQQDSYNTCANSWTNTPLKCVLRCTTITENKRKSKPKNNSGLTHYSSLNKLLHFNPKRRRYYVHEMYFK